MTDSLPQPTPEHDGTPESSAAEPVAANGSPEQPVQGSAPSVGAPQDADGDASAAGESRGLDGGVSAADESQSNGGSAPPATPSVPSQDSPGRMMSMVGGRKGVWAAVAVLCVAGGVLASVLGARAVAHNDAAASRRAFQQTSTSIASTLNVAIRHEEQLLVSASTFFGSHPKASQAEFAAWVKWARTRRRYPELDALGFLTLAHVSPSLLLSRDTGLSIYTPISAGSGRALAVETPVYRGTITPRSVFGRTAASWDGCARCSCRGCLAQALAGQSGYALRLRYRAGSTNAVFTSGAPRPGAQSTTVGLHSGWTIKSFAPVAGAGVFANRGSLALLIGGSLLSVLLGLLVFVFGSGRPLAPAQVQAPKTRQADPSCPMTISMTR